MNILIVDGNEKASSKQYTELGMLTQYEVYQEVLEKISVYDLNISIVHPTWGDDFLPPGTNLEDFDGIAWTGSILNIYDLRPDVRRQIDLAKILLQKKNKIFGKDFIDLARGVYLNNDKRSKIKSEINKILGSNIKEIKQYVNY